MKDLIRTCAAGSDPEILDIQGNNVYVYEQVMFIYI